MKSPELLLEKDPSVQIDTEHFDNPEMLIEDYSKEEDKDYNTRSKMSAGPRIRKQYRHDVSIRQIHKMRLTSYNSSPTRGFKKCSSHRVQLPPLSSKLNARTGTVQTHSNRSIDPQYLKVRRDLSNFRNGRPQFVIKSFRYHVKAFQTPQRYGGDPSNQRNLNQLVDYINHSSGNSRE